MKIIKFLKQIVYRLRGEDSLDSAIKRGLRCGVNCTVTGKIDFGSEPYLITLGDNVRMSGDVRFVCHDGGSWVFRRSGKYKDIVHYGKIVIGDNCFIGTRAIIMPDVIIGDNCVIGAGSIVTRSIPSNSVVVGIPARIIMTTDEYAEKMKEKMPKNWNEQELRINKRAYLERMFYEKEE